VTQDLKPIIAARLRAARKARQMSQAALAEAVSRTEEAISNIERGLALPRLDLLQKFSALLDVPLEEFVRVPDGDGAVAERARLEMEVQAMVRTLPLQRLRIAVRQVEALAAEG
jgi:transcriptional regulator with XRE-family HTH domain